jgi:hypothetical protein
MNFEGFDEYVNVNEVPLKIMRYNVKPIGNGLCIINDTYKHNLEDFIQTLRDLDKQINERGQSHPYNGE